MGSKFQTVLNRKFIAQSANIYGGEKGLFDFLPCGGSLMHNLINQWHQFFIVHEDMMQVSCTTLTPEKVLIASGHVERFNDFMVKDVVTGEFFRADHLVEKHLEQLLGKGDVKEDKKVEIEKLIKQIDNFGMEELTDLIRNFNIKSPEKDNDLTEPTPFNLMFETQLGCGGKSKAYLRPETAQGIFINFNDLYNENNQKLPFAAAQYGLSYRNEIAPRQSLMRVREFIQAEIEHFLDPQDKSHESFHTVSDIKLFMLPSEVQLNGGDAVIMSLGDAVAKRIVANETLGYFMGRIYLFLMSLGVKHEKLRFRQHMPNEMAHYACDCWDADILTENYGWYECVGCADRSAYDLQCHSKFSGTKLIARRTLDEPRIERVKFCKPIMKILGKQFKQNAKIISEAIINLDKDESIQMVESIRNESKFELMVNEEIFLITSDMVQIVEEDIKVSVEEFTPHVIEPSFGLGRIFFCMLEQNFAVRSDDEDRTYFTLPAVIAPYKFVVLPLSAKPEFIKIAKDIAQSLRKYRIFCKLDSAGASIGKRYARSDEIGTPFGVTVDFDTLKVNPPSVTVRERDSMQQIRVTIADLPELAWKLSNGLITWEQATQLYPLFEGQVMNA